ncbi:MAG TPA: nucleoside hydrolase [Bacteroidales bacterium]|nr:nucleoside hydrolase [Bacteroidales bacterium]HPJ58251.1 nucleoside hydrolase [Bacteroidales bacterium]HPR11582.1 nucleoside hydrolase [Bacteroidales bacterium]HRW85417.1 nucleoside hydrolase [Bacteroidales bacterium]
MKRIFFALAGLIMTVSLSSHPWKPSHYVIVDTDGGIDDMRAISMLLASPDVRVLAVIVSPGALSADNAFRKVKSMLNSYFHEGIPVGINRESSFVSRNFPVALQAQWGDEKNLNPDKAPDYLSLIAEILNSGQYKVRFVSLGSMSTAWTALNRIPSFKDRISDFIWSADGYDDRQGFNYNIDRKASEKMLKQELLVKIVRSFSHDDEVFYYQDFLKEISEVQTPYGRKLAGSFTTDLMKEHNFTYSGTDDMVPLFIHNPSLFLVKTAGNISDCFPADKVELRTLAIKILKGETVQETQIIKELPSDPDFFTDDIKPYVEEIMLKHGHDEWFSGVIASEIHRHLGVFEIIGVKMGVRAREYFNTGVDEFMIVSYAGSTPPLSCMNDGLQVATGATPGHGLLTVRNDSVIFPMVEIRYMNRKIRISLLKEIASKITSELKEINYIYGLDSNIYWELVRASTIKYWRDMDRHEIFEITDIN